MTRKITVVCVGILIPGLLSALPSFARKHTLECSACHFAPGYTNSFGGDYKLNGYRTEAEVGETNSETQNIISDGTILDKDFPIAGRVKSYIYKKVNADDRGVLDIPHEVELWFSGWLWKDISMYTEFEYEDGELGLEVFTFGYHPTPEFNLVIGKARIFSFDPVNTFSDWGVRLTGQHKRPVNITVEKNTWKLRSTTPIIGFYGFVPGEFRLFYSLGLTHIGGGADFEDFYARAGAFVTPEIWLGGFAVMGKTEYFTTDTITNDMTRFGGDLQAMFGNVLLDGTFVMGSDKSALGQDVGIDHTAFDIELAYRVDMDIGYLLPLVRYDSYTFSDSSKKSQSDLILGAFWFPVENVKLGVEYDMVMSMKDEQGNDVDNVSDNSVLRIILDLFY